jgi:hypothetical protein
MTDWAGSADRSLNEDVFEALGTCAILPQFHVGALQKFNAFASTP